MCGIGENETWPPRYAVGSPPRSAARAWAASWRVVENRNATNHRRPWNSASVRRYSSESRSLAPCPAGALESARLQQEDLYAPRSPDTPDDVRRVAHPCRGGLGPADEVPGGAHAGRAGQGRQAPAGGEAPPHRSARRPGRRADRAVWRRMASRVPRSGPLDDRDDERIRSEEHTSELQSPYDLVCRLLLEKKKTNKNKTRFENKKKLTKIQQDNKK